MSWLKKNWSNVLFGILIVLLLIPQTGEPIKVFVNRLIAFSPSVEDESDREVFQNYNWNLEDMKGVSIDFNEFKGKKILVNFWATWCPPCIAEMPSMQSLYDDYKNEVVFVFVTNDSDEEISKFIQKHGYTFPIYHSLSEVPTELDTKTLPTTYLINENGEIIIDRTGTADWNSTKVRELLD